MRSRGADVPSHHKSRVHQPRVSRELLELMGVCRVFDMTRPVDKTNFKKKSEYMAYVDSMFNSGVFTHPWQDMC